MHYYYSIYRKDYLYKGLILYESMKKHDISFKFFLVCMDEESVDLLKKMNLIDLIPISIKEIEDFDKRIPELKHQRGEKTYIWTAKASVPLYVFDRYPEADHIIWLDGDTEFMSDPSPIYEEWGDNSVLITPERFTGEYEYLGHMVGFYNTGFMGFKKDETGIQVLNYFRDRLQEWKNSLEEEVNWNDQLYVDDWPERFPRVGVVKHDGINLTPFIASRINNEQQGYVHVKDGIPYIKDTPIVLYHFMAMKYYDSNEFDLCYYWMKFDINTIKKLYIPYFERCNQAFLRIREIDPDFYPKVSIRGKYIGNYFNPKADSSEEIYNFATVAECGKEIQTLALYNSIKKYNIKFRLWICCADDNAYNALSRLELPEVKLFEPSNLIEYYYRLTETGYKANIEILKPRLINLLMLNNYNLKCLLYIDCCCYFHKHPKDIFDILKKNSISLFSAAASVKNSISSNIIGFNRSKDSLDCQFYWVEKTKSWLKDGVSSQDEASYIKEWKQCYDKVDIIQNPAYFVEDEGLSNLKLRKVQDQIYINNSPLAIYRYNIGDIGSEGIEQLARSVFQFYPQYKKYIYLPYLKTLQGCIEQIKKAYTTN